MTTPTYLFLDTEWADVLGVELVSIALVSQDGEREFYAERSTLPTAPTDFVRLAVYPLLQRGQAAMSDVAMTTALRRFISKIERPCVLADYANDLSLLKFALAGFDLPDVELSACGPEPMVNMTLIRRGELITKLVEEWFFSHPKEAVRRHHALVDARALRHAWLVAMGHVQPVWSTLDRTRTPSG